MPFNRLRVLENFLAESVVLELGTIRAALSEAMSAWPAAALPTEGQTERVLARLAAMEDEARALCLARQPLPIHRPLPGPVLLRAVPAEGDTLPASALPGLSSGTAPAAPPASILAQTGGAASVDRMLARLVAEAEAEGIEPAVLQGTARKADAPATPDPGGGGGDPAANDAATMDNREGADQQAAADQRGAADDRTPVEPPNPPPSTPAQAEGREPPDPQADEDGAPERPGEARDSSRPVFTTRR